MDPLQGQEAADTVLATSRILVAIALRSLQAGSADVTVAQHRVLVLLDEHGPLTVNQVADLLGVNQSNASRHTLRLQDLGLVDRNRTERDVRSIQVRLTMAGRRQVDAVHGTRRDAIAAVLSHMSDDEVAAVVAACAAFNETASRRASSEPVS